jgi:DNA-cytosine methyltransferase
MGQPGPWRHVMVLEDDVATSARRRLAPVGGEMSQTVTIRLHEIRDRQPRLLGERKYRAGSLVKRSQGGRAALALELLDEAVGRKRGAVVVANATYGSNRLFLEGIRERGLAFVAEVRASELLAISDLYEGTPRVLRTKDVEQLLQEARWNDADVVSPVSGKCIEFSAAELGGATPHRRLPGHLFAAQTGGIAGLHRGTVFGFASEKNGSLGPLVETVAWARWIRPVLRRSLRPAGKPPTGKEPIPRPVAAEQSRIIVRANITLADEQDKRAEQEAGGPALHGVLGATERKLNVIELFAGAGGMGLGFLLANGSRAGYRLALSAEVNPIYVTTLRRNHDDLRKRRADEFLVPSAAAELDLRSSSAREHVASATRSVGGADILIGGPPCQGFSNANRNSWSSANPNNRLVDVFMTYVERLQPRVFVMENVQGILWTPKGGRVSPALSVVDHLGRRMRRAGYIAFPKLLDAVWYGVPQYRSRFFLVGLHQDLGYERDDFGEWGPFPRPTHGPGTGRRYVTVRDAIRDLPQLRNGGGESERDYREPGSSPLNRHDFQAFVRAGAERGIVTDHVTSRHADYVIERYRRIPPGGNWEDILDTMSNYTDVKRTHSNIYRRLRWGKPSITIGHYRKSMLVHPSQDRGLSLREASRLQSFPDWFRFQGRADGGDGGLVHKQQQLANAVCPLVTKALAEFLIEL